MTRIKGAAASQSGTTLQAELNLTIPTDSIPIRLSKPKKYEKLLFLKQFNKSVHFYLIRSYIWFAIKKFS